MSLKDVGTKEFQYKRVKIKLLNRWHLWKWQFTALSGVIELYGLKNWPTIYAELTVLNFGIIIIINDH